MCILIIGKTGQVSKSLYDLVTQQKLNHFKFVGREKIDLEKPNQISEVIQEINPKIIVNCAAWTAVDDAEDQPQRAEAVNALAVGELAKVAKICGSRLIHLSTDYVYDGTKTAPYVETDIVNPQSIYGTSKLNGENQLKEYTDDYLILRTAWVFSPYGSNFVKTMLNLSTRVDTVKVINDQFGCPTSAHDIATSILSIIEKWKSGGAQGLSQTFHCVSTGSTNWADFARYIFEVQEELKGNSMLVEDITTQEWNAKATRPQNSVLDGSKLQSTFNIQMPCWKHSVAKTVKQLLNSSTN